MTKIIASSLLIIGVLLIRAVFQKKISPILLYPVWLVVAIRLLMPGMLFFSPISVMNTSLWNRGSTLLAEEEHRQDIEYKRQQYEEYYSRITEEQEIVKGAEDVAKEAGRAAEETKLEDAVKESGMNAGADTNTQARESGEYLLSAWQHQGTLFGRIRRIALFVWMAGMAVSTLCFLWQNLSFYRYLRSTRRKITEVAAGGRKLSVFLAGDRLSSPCLFGLIPAIYIPEGSMDVKEGEQLRFVLEHELTHYRHRDNVWALVRIMCLVVNWYNPLVWAASKLSLRDGELACDAGCIRRLGEEKRCAYGEALLAMIKQSKEKERVLKAATMMTAGKKFMKTRMEAIAGKRKNSVAAAFVMVIAVFLMAGCTYTGRAQLEENRGNRENRTENTAETNPAQEETVKEPESAIENPYGGKAVVLKGKGENLNGNLQGMVFLLLPGPVKERENENYLVLIPSDLYLYDLEEKGRKTEKIFSEYTDEEILKTLNRNLDLALGEIEVWGYEDFIQKIDEMGGVTIDVQEGEIDHINNYHFMLTGKGRYEENLVTESGTQILSGIQTAAYLQIRYLPETNQGNRWAKIIPALFEREGKEIIDCDYGCFTETDRSVYVEDVEGNYLLCLCFLEEAEEFHKAYYPDNPYQPSASVKEADQRMKEQAEKVIEAGREEAYKAEWLFDQYMGLSPFMISQLTDMQLDAETQDAWRTAEVYLSGIGLAVDEEAGKAVQLVNLVFTDSGVIGLPEHTDENPVSVERFLYLTKKGDGWHVDGLLHNDLPSKEWWEGAQMQWEVYDFGFSDADNLGAVTSSQRELDDFAKRAQTAVERKEQIY